MVTIDANYWDPHNTIWVHVTDGVFQEDSKIEANEEADQTIDITLAIPIPEFGFPMIVVSVSVLVIFMQLRRSYRNGG